MEGWRGGDGGELLTGWVAVGEDELTFLTDKGGGVPNGFVEERYETAVVAFGAVAGQDLIWESDVVFVVGRVQLSVPARGKHELEADALGTVGVEVGLVGEEVTV